MLKEQHILCASPLATLAYDICCTVFLYTPIGAALQRGVSSKADGREEAEEGQWLEEIEDEELDQILGITSAAQKLATRSLLAAVRCIALNETQETVTLTAGPYKNGSNKKLTSGLPQTPT